MSKLIKDRWVIVPYASSFTPYPKEFIIKTLKRLGFKNIREAYNFGWNNQPKVVTFTAPSMSHGNDKHVELALALNEYSLHLKPKDW